MSSDQSNEPEQGAMDKDAPQQQGSEQSKTKGLGFGVMSREVQSIMLILVGGAIIRISLTDIFLRYVKPVMQPYLIVAGAFLLLLGVWALVDQIRRGSSHDEHDHDDDEFDDGHGHGPMRAAWFLLLPVFAIVLVAPPALGAYSAEKDTQTVAAPSDDLFPPLPDTDPIPLSLNEYAIRAVWDDQRSLAGRNVELIGFVTPNPDGGWWLSRMTMACCAGDATATKIHVVDPPEYEANTWVKLDGHWVPGGGVNSDSAIPWIAINSIHEVPQPKEPYE
ncbi:MAG: TIGR03943 family protein [Candidatus Nanopelagicales bacterium]